MGLGCVRLFSRNFVRRRDKAKGAEQHWLDDKRMDQDLE